MKTKTTSLTKQSGSSLVVALIVMATLMVVVAIAADYTINVNRNVQRSNNYETALAVADSCIEVLFANWRYTCSNPVSSATTAKNTSAFSAVPTPSPGQFPTLPSGSITGTFVKRGTNVDPASDEWDGNYTISNYKIVAATPEWGAYGSATASPTPSVGQSTSTLTYNYIASADVTLRNLNGQSVVAKVQRVFQKQQTSPWNFAIFYVDPLEIHPGPQFTVTGRVHTNSNLYTAHDTLTFADKVTYGSDWFVDFMPGETTHAGETPATPVYPGNLPPARDQSLQPFGLDSTALLSTTDSNPNNDSYHELIEPPTSGYTDPLASARYYNNADVIVKVDASNTVRIYTPDGSGGATQVTSGKLYNVITAAITTGTTIQDNREGAAVRLITLDIKKMENGSGGNSPTWKDTGGAFNGLIYVYDTSATSSARRAVKMINGNVIPSSGLTVVSPNPVYIQGDFNAGQGTVPSNTSGSYNNGAIPNPQASGYTRKSCSILGDAVNILSNNWSDSGSTASLSSRPATNTTVNAAIVSGIVPSNTYNNGGYSGGAENFPRLLEDWSNSTLTYYGSMVELYKSQQAIGEWHYGGNIYNAPVRQWFFDNNFKITPPPGSLMLYSYIKGRWTVQ